MYIVVDHPRVNIARDDIFTSTVVLVPCLSVFLANYRESNAQDLQADVSWLEQHLKASPADDDALPARSPGSTQVSDSHGGGQPSTSSSLAQSVTGTQQPHRSDKTARVSSSSPSPSPSPSLATLSSAAPAVRRPRKRTSIAAPSGVDRMRHAHAFHRGEGAFIPAPRAAASHPVLRQLRLNNAGPAHHQREITRSPPYGDVSFSSARLLPTSPGASTTVSSAVDDLLAVRRTTLPQQRLALPAPEAAAAAPMRARQARLRPPLAALPTSSSKRKLSARDADKGEFNRRVLQACRLCFSLEELSVRSF